MKLVPLEAHSFVEYDTNNPCSILLKDFFPSRLSGGGYEQIFTPKASTSERQNLLNSFPFIFHIELQIFLRHENFIHQKKGYGL